jgi:MFS family permease
MPWRYGWNIVAVSMVYQAFAYGTVISSFTLFMPLWVHDFGISHSTAALYVTISVLIGGLVGPPLGKLYDRLSVRMLLVAGCSFYALSYLLLSFVQTGLQLFFVYSVLLSFALTSMSILPAQVLVARWFSERTSVPIAIVATGMPLGGILLPPLVALLIGEIGGWRMASRALAAIMVLVVIPLILAVVRDRPAGGEAARAAGHGAAAAGEGGPILTSGTFLLAMCTATPLFTIYSGFQANLGPMVLARGGDLAKASVNVSALNIAALIAALSSGWLLLRISHRTFFRGAALLAAIGLLAFVAAEGREAQLIACALIGLGTGGASATLAAYFFATFGPNRLGTVLGYAAPVSRIAVFAPPLFALGRELSGSYALPLIGLAALGGITLLCGFLMPMPEQKPVALETVAA